MCVSTHLLNLFKEEYKMKIAYSIKETAEALGCGINKTYELVNTGQLRSFRFGKKIMIPVQEIERLVSESSNGQIA